MIVYSLDEGVAVEGLLDMTHYFVMVRLFFQCGKCECVWDGLMRITRLRGTPEYVSTVQYVFMCTHMVRTTQRVVIGVDVRFNRRFR